MTPQLGPWLCVFYPNGDHRIIWELSSVMALGLLGIGIMEFVQTWGDSHQALSSLEHRK